MTLANETGEHSLLVRYSSEGASVWFDHHDSPVWATPRSILGFEDGTFVSMGSFESQVTVRKGWPDEVTLIEAVDGAHAGAFSMVGYTAEAHVSQGPLQSTASSLAHRRRPCPSRRGHWDPHPSRRCRHPSHRCRRPRRRLASRAAAIVAAAALSAPACVVDPAPGEVTTDMVVDPLPPDVMSVDPVPPDVIEDMVVDPVPPDVVEDAGPDIMVVDPLPPDVIEDTDSDDTDRDIMVVDPPPPDVLEDTDSDAQPADSGPELGAKSPGMGRQLGLAADGAAADGTAADGRTTAQVMPLNRNFRVRLEVNPTDDGIGLELAAVVTGRQADRARLRWDVAGGRVEASGTSARFVPDGTSPAFVMVTARASGGLLDAARHIVTVRRSRSPGLVIQPSASARRRRTTSQAAPTTGAPRRYRMRGGVSQVSLRHHRHHRPRCAEEAFGERDRADPRHALGTRRRLR